MWTRRRILGSGVWITLIGLFSTIFSTFKLIAWAGAKEILPKGFPKYKLVRMDPAEIDNRNLEIDPLDQFGIMGTSDLSIDMKSYQLKISGKVAQPLSLTYDQILKYPSVMKNILLICPGYFADNGHWTGVPLTLLLQEARIEKGAKTVTVKGGDEVSYKFSTQDIFKKNVLLAYRLNDETLPPKHGFPIRLVFEGVYGGYWIKFVNEIVVS